MRSSEPLRPTVRRRRQSPRPEFARCTYTSTSSAGPSVASDAVGNFVVTWADRNADGSQIGVMRQPVRWPAPNDAPRRHCRERRPRARRDRRRAADVAEHQRRGPDLQRDADEHHRSRGRRRTPSSMASAITARYRRRRHRVSAPTATRSRYRTRRLVRRCTGTPRRSRASFPTCTASRSSGCCTWGAASPTCPASNPFYRFVETLLHHGVTGGCTRDGVLPRQPRRRASRWRCSCSWRRKERDTSRPPATTPVFADVPASSPFCRWIEELARRGGGDRLRRRQLLPDGAGHARADGGLRPAHAGPDAQPARLHDAHLQRRARRAAASAAGSRS